MQTFIESQALASLLKASWQAAALILLVLAIQRAFRRRLSPRWRYGLWLLVGIRLAMPWTIPSPVSLFNLLNFPAVSASLVDVQATPGAQAGEARQSTAAGLTVHTDEASANLSIAPAPRFGILISWLPGIWLAGALMLASSLCVIQCRLSRSLRLRRPLIDAPVMNLFEDCKQEMGVRVPVTLVETAEVGSPVLFGFVRPRLILPAGLTRSFSVEELRYVFLHELGHIKRHDIPIGWLMTALQILHWFNPLVWLAFHRMRVDREMACDALALSYLRQEENQSYGHTIIKLLERFGRSAWGPSLAGTVENRNQIKERISMIAEFRKSNRGLVLAVVLFAGLGLTTLTDAQPAGSPQGRELVGTWVLIGTPGDVGPVPAEGGRLRTLIVYL
jgi:bla regulator protein BlaR1